MLWKVKKSEWNDFIWDLQTKASHSHFVLMMLTLYSVQYILFCSTDPLSIHLKPPDWCVFARFSLQKALCQSLFPSAGLFPVHINENIAFPYGCRTCLSLSTISQTAQVPTTEGRISFYTLCVYTWNETVITKFSAHVFAPLLKGSSHWQRRADMLDKMSFWLRINVRGEAKCLTDDVNGVLAAYRESLDFLQRRFYTESDCKRLFEAWSQSDGTSVYSQSTFISRWREESKMTEKLPASGTITKRW